MEKIGEEGILIDILSRLPAKSLLRCKAVNTHWYSLISDPDFAWLHLSRQKQQNPSSCRRLLWFNDAFRSIDTEALTTSNQGTAVRVLDHPPIVSIGDNFVQIVGSCHGLVCLLIDHWDFILWNPTTGEYDDDLPGPPTVIEDADPFYGFGYDSSTDDYKVFKCSPTDDGVQYTGAVTEVLSCKSNSWTVLEGGGGSIPPTSCNGLFLNGSLHWLEPVEGSHPHSVINSFDLGDETFGTLQCPMPHHPDDLHCRGLTFAEERLCAYQVIGRESNSHTFEGWVLRENEVKPSWTKFYSFSVESLSASYIRSPLWFREDKKILFHTAAEELTVFDRDVAPGEWDRLQIGEDSMDSGYETYDESIVSPFLLHHVG